MIHTVHKFVQKTTKSLEERTEILYILLAYILRQWNDPHQMESPIQFSASRARLASSLHAPPLIPTSHRAASHWLLETHASHSKCSAPLSRQTRRSSRASTPHPLSNRPPHEFQEANEWISWSRKGCCRCCYPNLRCSSCSASWDNSISAANARDTRSPQLQIALKAAKYPTIRWIKARKPTQNAGFEMFWSRVLKQFWFL